LYPTPAFPDPQVVHTALKDNFFRRFSYTDSKIPTGYTMPAMVTLSCDAGSIYSDVREYTDQMFT
jgi:hypothetical protein